MVSIPRLAPRPAALRRCDGGACTAPAWNPTTAGDGCAAGVWTDDGPC